VLRDEVAARTTPHEVTKRGRNLNGRVGAVSLPASRIVFVRYGGEVDVETSPTHDRLVATVPLGPMHAREGRAAVGQTFRSGFVLSQRDSTVMRPDPWNGALVVTGDPNRLSEQASIVLGENLGDTGPGVHGLHCAPLLERACRQIWSVATTLPDSTPKPVLDAMLSVLEDQLLTALVLAAHQGPKAPVGDVRVEGLIDWLRENYASSITLADMARVTGVSVRRLQQAVQNATGRTPTVLLRDIRMQEVHRKLLRADPHQETVARIAHDSGITHLGRFAQMYRRTYGCMPSDTLNGVT
jgi:AraC-like DNA-binding protein